MKKVVIFLLMLIGGKISFSQEQVELKNILPPSPEASAFVKYGTYRVGPYTGKPGISVPFYEIKTSKLSVPISLSYDETGIRVNDMASWVGMNWSLNAGGIISRVVMGQPDRPTSTDINSVPPRAADIIYNAYYRSYLQALVERDPELPTYKPDSEPDKYYYSFNGRSGSFVLDRDRNVLQIPKTSLKISILGNNGYSIVDESGTTYIFNVSEVTETYTPSSIGYFPNASNNSMSLTSEYDNPITSYYLSEIISNDGFDHIYFTYETEQYTTKDENYSELYGGVWNSLPNLNATTHQHRYLWTGMRRIIHAARVKSISFTNGKIDFTRVAGRQDDGSASSYLDEVSVYRKQGTNAYNKIQSFKLNYGYYFSSISYAENSAWPHENADNYRLRLDNIILKDGSGNEVSRYVFTYNSTNLPPKTAYSQDWQGYYNGKSSNTTLVPVSTVINQGGLPQNIGGADRTSDEAYMKAGILEKITYPTGGYTVFETEAHRVTGGTVTRSESHDAYAQGQSSSNLIVKNFTTASTLVALSGQLSLTIGPYASTDPEPFVKIKNLSTGQEQVYTSPDRTNFYSTTISYSFQNNTAYELTASCYSNQSYAMAYISASFKKQIVDPSIPTIVGGLRIKSIKNYTFNNLLANEELYKYGQNEDGLGTFVGIEGGAYSYSRTLRLFYARATEFGPVCYESESSQDVYNQGYLYDPQVIEGSPVVYSKVTKYYGNTNQNNGKTIYTHGTEPGHPVITVMPLPAGQQLANNKGIFIINNSWKDGLLKKQEEYKKETNGTYTLVQQIDNNYNIINTDVTYGLVANTKFQRVREGCNLTRFTDYAFAEYPIHTGYVQLVQSTTKMYDQSSSSYLQTITNHSYDNTRKDIRTISSVTNSKGQIVESETKYPFHKAQLQTPITTAESIALDDMVTKNMLFPVEEIQRKGGIQTMLKKTSYENVNGNLIVPVNLKYKSESNTIETRIQFTKYDANGNLTEQSKADDVIESFIWGYAGQYPVAKIINKSVNEAVTQSGIDLSIVNSLLTTDAAKRTELNKLRNLTNCFVTTYTYKPLVGISTETDPNGRTTYYEYDAFNRLSLIRDKDNNIVRKICYNYAGQPVTCGVQVFTSASKSGTFTRSNCGSGYTGSSVTYTVPAGAYTSTTSQAAADQLAQNDVDANGQAYANANGTCEQLCSFSAMPGFSLAYSNATNNSGNINFNLVFYPTSGSMSMYTNYQVAFLYGGCKPLSTKTFTLQSGGKTFNVTFYPSGDVYVSLIAGADVAVYETIFFNGNYTLP